MPPPTRRPMTPDVFHASLVARGLAHATAQVYARRLRYATRHGLDPTNPATWRPYYAARAAGGASRNALRNDAKLLNALADAHGLPDRFRAPRAARTLPVALTRRQVAQLMQYRGKSVAARRRGRAMLAVLLATGMRRGELARLRLQDVDPANKRIHIRASKGGPWRWIPVEPRLFRHEGPLMVWLRRRPGDSDHVWTVLRRPHDGLDGDGVAGVLHRIAQETGVPCSPRVLRHTRATTLRRSGWDLAELAYMLGHTGTQATSIYAEVSYEDVRAKLNKPRGEFLAKNPPDPSAAGV